MIWINPKSPNTLRFKAIEPPIWCILLDAVYIRKRGYPFRYQFEHRVIDAEANNLNAHQVADRVNGQSCIVVMGSNPSASSTPKMPEALRIKEAIGDCHITGLHPVALGIADFPMPTQEELVKVKMARWELLDMRKYRAHNWHCLHDLKNRDRYAVLYTSYGCPFDCAFCNIHAIYKGRKVYFRNPFDVIAEIDYLVKNYKIKNLKICDELFTLNKKHVTTICSGIKDYHLNIWAYARVGTVNPEMLKIMKDAGINWLGYGFESANPLIMSGIGKYYGDIRDTVDMTRKAGINIMGNFIFGLPGETIQTMEETLDLAMRIQPEFINFYCAMDYPGSRLFKQDRYVDWADYDQYSKHIAVAPEVVKFRDRAFKVYMSAPKYQAMIKVKFGNEAKEHIEEIVEYGTLQRTVLP